MVDCGELRTSMRASGRKAAALTARALSTLWLSAAAWFAFVAPAAAMPEPSLDATSLLTLGINIGVIAFAVATAIGCLRATQRASEASERAGLEAERLRASEGTLEMVLAAEPQILLAWSGSEAPRVLAANLPIALGVPSNPQLLLRFGDWLDAPSATALDEAVRNLGQRGQAFNLMLRTQRQKHVEVDGRATGGTIALKIRDLAGQRLEYANLAEQHRQLDGEIAGLRALLDAEKSARGRGQAESKLSMEARFRSFDRLATAFAVFDPDQRLAHFNQAYVELWQLDAEWFTSHPRDGDILDRLRQARRLPEKADYQAWKRTWLSAYGSNRQVDEEWHLPDGRTLHVIADSAAEGGVTYLYENVTERIALESRYNALIDVQRETIDTLREGLAVFAPNGRLRLYNTAFAAIWRLSPQRLDTEPHIEEIVSWCRVLYDAPEEWERTKAAVTAIAFERRPYESQFNRPDGSVIACAALPLPDGGTLLTFVDVSDSKRAERALIERNEALEAADHLKTAFISHVSYELRTPLTNIIGFTELLESPFAGELNAKQRDYLGDISLSGRTLLAIIDDILDLATIDAGTFELKLSSVKVRDVIEAAAQGVRERLQQSGVALEVRIDAGIDEFVADGRRVTQILYNVMSNAIGFSPAGGKIVLACSRDQTMLAFTVEDQGCGIPTEYQPTVFDRFESRSLGSRHRGAGLGLAIVKSLAELHGGTVALASEPGRGTWVRVLLPLRQEPETSEADLEQQPFRSSRAG
jgi:signal transduction histidine kinase